MDWLVDLFNMMLVFMYRLLVSLGDMLKDLFFWVLENVMLLAEELVQTVVTLFQPIDISAYLSGLPSEVSWVLSQIGLPQALVMIIAAISARILLQLIPFTRLGS